MKGATHIESPRSKALAVSPVLVVHPLFTSIDFYREKLGFNHVQLLGEPPSFAILERDGFVLYLQAADFEVTISPSGGWDVHLMVEDFQSELAALQLLHVPIAFGPTEQVTGIRRRRFCEILDPNGYSVCIEQQDWLTASRQDSASR